MLTTSLLLFALQAGAGAPPRDAPPPPCPAGLSGLACAPDNPTAGGFAECPVTLDGRFLYPAYATPIPHTGVDIYYIGPSLFKVSPFPVRELYSNAYYEFQTVLPSGEYTVVIHAEGMDDVRQRFSVPQDHCLVPTNLLPPGPGIHLDVMLHPAIKPLPETEDTVAIESLARKVPGSVVQALKKSSGKSAPLVEILKTAPDYYDANLALALEYKKQDQREDAMRTFTHALDVNSGSMSARSALGQYRFEAGDFQQAASLLSEAVRLGSMSPDVYYMLGTSYYKLGQLDLAEASLRRTLAIAPSFGNAYLQLYNVYMRGKAPEKALKAVDTYLEKYPAAQDREYVQSMADKLRKTLKPL